MELIPRAIRVFAVSLLFLGAAVAQDWTHAQTLPGVDLAGLNQQQKTEVLGILRDHDCGCQCGMKIAECRFADPQCAYSTGLAQIIVENIRKGKTEKEAIAAADASRFAHLPQQKLLDDPVTIPVDASPALGPANAPITIVEFSDFQCPYCAQATPKIEDIVKRNSTTVRLIFKQFPLDFHPYAEMAAEASLAAARQGKFWQMHDALFANRGNLSRDSMLAVAKQTGLDLDKFMADVKSADLKSEVARDIEEGNKAGVEGTPTIFINGQKFNGPIDVAVVQPVIDDLLKKQPTVQTAHAAK